LASGRVSSGKYNRLFERSFADWSGYSHCVATTSGTTALQAAIEALDIWPGDEIICPALTFVSTASAIVQAGARPVFVDVLEDGCIDPALAGRAITSRTRAIIPVHLFGVRADLRALAALGQELIIDAAEAHGVDNAGHTACYSFYGNKILTCGEGGAVCTDSKPIADKLRWLCGTCQDPDRRYWHTGIGHNFRMPHLSAAIGYAQIKRAGSLIGRRRDVIRWYRERLPVVEPAAPWVASIHVDDRDRVVAHLAQQGIETRNWFYPIHTMSPYLSCDAVLNGTAERLSKTGLILPLSSSMTRDDVTRVCDAIEEIL